MQEGMLWRIPSKREKVHRLAHGAPSGRERSGYFLVDRHYVAMGSDTHT